MCFLRFSEGEHPMSAAQLKRGWSAVEVQLKCSWSAAEVQLKRELHLKTNTFFSKRVVNIGRSTRNRTGLSRMAIFHIWIVVWTNTTCYVHIEAEVSMVDLASSKCFTELCKHILTLTEPRANAQLVVPNIGWSIDHEKLPTLTTWNSISKTPNLAWSGALTLCGFSESSSPVGTFGEQSRWTPWHLYNIFAVLNFFHWCLAL